jgi:hypothetical protein
VLAVRGQASDRSPDLPVRELREGGFADAAAVLQLGGGAAEDHLLGLRLVGMQADVGVGEGLEEFGVGDDPIDLGFDVASLDADGRGVESESARLVLTGELGGDARRVSRCRRGPWPWRTG